MKSDHERNEEMWRNIAAAMNSSTETQPTEELKLLRQIADDIAATRKAMESLERRWGERIDAEDREHMRRAFTRGLGA